MFKAIDSIRLSNSSVTVAPSRNLLVITISCLEFIKFIINELKCIINFDYSAFRSFANKFTLIFAHLRNIIIVRFNKLAFTVEMLVQMQEID